MQSCNGSRSFIKIQGLTANQNLQKKSVSSSISRLQDKSSKVVQSNIKRNSRGVSSSNRTATSDTTFFNTSCIPSPENNKIIPKRFNVFMGDHSAQKMLT